MHEMDTIVYLISNYNNFVALVVICFLFLFFVGFFVSQGFGGRIDLYVEECIFVHLTFYTLKNNDASCATTTFRLYYLIQDIFK